MSGSPTSTAIRFRLDGQADAPEQAIAFEGPVSYMRQADGHWTWTRGPPSTHSIFDPRWALAALANAQRSVVASEARVVELTLAYETLDAGTDIGLAPDWDESTAVVDLTPSGRIAAPPSCTAVTIIATPGCASTIS
jgi:hypothetical protein